MAKIEASSILMMDSNLVIPKTTLTNVSPKANKFDKMDIQNCFAIFDDMESFPSWLKRNITHTIPQHYQHNSIEKNILFWSCMGYDAVKPRYNAPVFNANPHLVRISASS